MELLGVGFYSRKGDSPSVRVHLDPIDESMFTRAHRDCVRANIMMDGDAMFPEGFHPIKLRRTPDRSRVAEYTSRSVAGVKYYFVDFGISSYHPDRAQPCLVTGNVGRDQDPPELSDTVPYDPFKLDIFIIGNMLKREFCQVGVFRRSDWNFD